LYRQFSDLIINEDSIFDFTKFLTMTSKTIQKSIIFGFAIMMFTSVIPAYAITNIDDCNDDPNLQGETYYLTNNLHIDNAKCLEVSANDIILDCQGFSITGNDWANNRYGYGIGLETVDNATVRNCNVSDFNHGIAIWLGRNNTISHNNVTSNDADAVFGSGIMTYRSNNNTITHNYAMDNPSGIRIEFVNNSTVTQNVGVDNRIGVLVYRDSDENQVVGNNLSGGYIGIFLKSFTTADGRPDYNKITNNIVNGTVNGTSYHLIESDSLGGYGIRVLGGDYNNIVNNLSYDNENAGISIENSDYCSATNNITYGNDFAGFEIANSDNNALKNNESNENTFGFYEDGNSDDNTYKKNECSDNNFDSNPNGLCK